MTTIAFKDGIMACDGRWTYDDVIDVRTNKIRRLKSGALLGSAGDNDSRDVEEMLQNVKTYAGMPSKAALLDVRCEYLGLIAFPTGELAKVACVLRSEAHWDADLDEDIGVWPVHGPAAVGSGWKFALAAMRCGKSAIDACRLAAEFDTATGAPFYEYELKKAKPNGKRSGR